MKGLTGEEQDFEGIAVFNRESVELLENWKDMVKRRSSRDDTGGGILDLLKLMEKSQLSQVDKKM